MLLLLLPALAAALPDGGGQGGSAEPLTFRVRKFSSFHNGSWAQQWGSGWLGELQTHGWDSGSGRILFLYPWSRGNFSDKELTELEIFLRLYFSEVLQTVRTRGNLLLVKYPFDVQVTAGCQIRPGEASVSFLQAAYGGSDFLSFQNSSCVPSPKGGERAKRFCRLLNLNQAVLNRVHNLLTDTCPRFAWGLLDAGKAYLQRQVKPEAWLSSGPHPEPGRLLLVCHVSGFHPKPVWAMWMRGEQELRGAQPGDVLPQADGTWYLRVTLDVAAQEAAGLSCRVKHSSLGGQDLVLYWDSAERHRLLGLIFLVVVAALILLAGLALWSRKRWTLCEHALSSALPCR